MAVGDALRTDLFGVDLGKFRVTTYKEVSGLAFGQDATEVKRVTADGHLVARKNPGARQLPDITLSRPMDTNHVWSEWVRQTAMEQDVDQARTNLSISLLDSKMRPIKRVNLLNAWASRWKGPALQADNASAAIEKVTIVYEDMTVDGIADLPA
ncbi:phage tail protein [Streptomyces sp. NPDC026206]|uniref:phage tail protein n=1 Tax=Streptomyces sp. NPDC026206 TaxID=3157089 RepID=UPI0033C4AC57